jgi:hypothetical protein
VGDLSSCTQEPLPGRCRAISKEVAALTDDSRCRWQAFRHSMRSRGYAARSLHKAWHVSGHCTPVYLRCVCSLLHACIKMGTSHHIFSSQNKADQMPKSPAVEALIFTVFPDSVKETCSINDKT